MEPLHISEQATSFIRAFSQAVSHPLELTIRAFIQL
jgi:hypothetical protein